MESNKPFEINFDKPGDFLTEQEKIEQVLKLVEGLKDLKRKYEVDPEANKMQLDQINFRLTQQEQTLAKLGYEEPKQEFWVDSGTGEEDTFSNAVGRDDGSIDKMAKRGF